MSSKFIFASSASRSPDAICKEYVAPGVGLVPFQARKLAFALGLDGAQANKATKVMVALYDAFVATDASLVEINPLVVTAAGDLLALDAKMTFDDNALYRHPDIKELRDTGEEDPLEIEASKFSLNYIHLDGNIGCMVNGAGLAMATMDIIKLNGGEPANFLDVGGGASADMVREAFKILVSDPKVTAIFVNIFGGIMKCDVLAQGIVQAVNQVGLKVPLVVRLEGTNVEEGRKILDAAKLNIRTATDMAEGAKLAAQAAGTKH